MRLSELKTRILWLGVLAGALLLAGGCAQTLSEATLAQADRTILFSDLARDPNRFIGSKVVLGGTIIRVLDSASGSTVEVLQRPLGYQYQPQLTDTSYGRFLIEFPELVNKKLFHQNRKISLVGEVLRAEVRALDNITYTYPVLRSLENYLWDYGTGRYSRPRIGFGLGYSATF